MINCEKILESLDALEEFVKGQLERMGMRSIATLHDHHSSSTLLS